MLFEVFMKGKVGEVSQAGSVISHHIFESWEVMNLVAVAVKALMVTGELAEIGSRSRFRDCPFLGARDSRRDQFHANQSPFCMRA